MRTDRNTADIAIVGAGIAGLATALAVRPAGDAGIRVVVCDPSLAQGQARPRSHRALAIAPGPRRLLDRLGAWDMVADAAQPITRMVLGDTRPAAVPPPEFLHFDGQMEGEPLAHMVLQDDLRDALLSRCRAAGIELAAEPVSDMRVPAGSFADLGSMRARLVVAADGARSRLRDQAGISLVGWDYGQCAIVATLSHAIDHAGEAVQYFLPGGPLALLPLRAPDGSGRWTSIVWTEETGEARRLAALPAQAFCEALQARGGDSRGELQLEDTPALYPLALRLARRLAAPRLALVGDAARVIHPLAGQGLNLGLQDAEALGSHVAAALSLGLDPGSPRVLAGYEQDRRAAQLAMAATTDGLNRLFSNDNAALRVVRDLGLGLVDRLPALKRALIRGAAGPD